LIVIIIVVLLAGSIQGLVGFGSGLVMVPVLVLYFEPKVLVPMALLHGLVMNGALAMGARRSVEPKRVAPILITGIFGIPFGALLLIFLLPEYIKLLIGVVIVAFGLMLLSGRTFRVRNETRTSLLVGSISGLLNGSISMSGPPVILFFSNQKVRKGNFRANLVFYFFILNIVTLLVFYFMGIMTLEVMIIAGILLPAALIGIGAGSLVSKHVNEKLFRRIALLLVTAAGAVSLVSGIAAVVN
jgi:uncharacterized membrane protein YfcA